MNDEIIPYPNSSRYEKDGTSDFRVPEGINERTLRMLGCNCKDVRIVRASDPVPELKGNKLPRIVDYDMMETSEPTWKLWERIKSALESKKK